MRARWKDRFGSAVLVPELEQARKRYQNMISEHKKVLEAERQTGSGDRGDDDDDDDDVVVVVSSKRRGDALPQ
jgi:hypothetical protein